MTEQQTPDNGSIEPAPHEFIVEGQVLEQALVELDMQPDADGVVETLSPGRMAWKRYWGHRGAAIASFIMIALVIAVIATPLTARYGIDQPVRELKDGPNVFLPPQRIAWFGTDDIGRDIYSRLLFGIRTSLIIGMASAILSTLIGTTIGSFAALRGGWIDNLLMRTTDVFLAFPFLVAVIMVRQFLGGLTFLEPIIGSITSIRFVIVLFMLFGWMLVARLVRSQVLALKEREFVEAARAVGASNFRITVAHLIPNSVGPIIVALTVSVIAAIIGESTLGFFGFGPQPGSGSTSLGNLVQLSQQAAQAGRWWLVVYPGGALVLLAICIFMIGDGLRDAFDPKLDKGK